MKKILVTGGAGFIGSHTCKALVKKNYTPVVYDNFETGHASLAKWGVLYRGDIRDEARLIEVIRKEKVDALIHFAAAAYVGESVINPQKYYENNVSGSISLFNACLKSDLKKIVFSSSCATYGIPSQIPICENEKQNPINPYGRSKLMVEQILEDYANAYKVKSVSLRYFNAAGSDPDGEIGEIHEPETHLIPLAIRAALFENQVLSVFGNDHPTRDGTAIRDYIHVTDLANAHILALEADHNSNDSLTYNLGTEKGVSVLEVIRAVEKATGKPVKYRISPKRQGDPPALIANATKAKKELGWEPSHSSLDTIVNTAYQFILKSTLNQGKK